MVRREPEGWYERIFSNAIQQESKQQESDTTITYVVTPEGQEIPLSRKENGVEFIQDPEGMLIPQTVSNIRHHLTDNGTVANINDVGLCREGCVVTRKELFICCQCRQQVCIQHTFFVDQRVYCKRFSCSVRGRFYQLFRCAYTVIGYSFRNITGLNAQQTRLKRSTSEEKLFGSSYLDDLNSREKR